MAFKLFKAQNPSFQQNLQESYYVKQVKLDLTIFKSGVGWEVAQRRGHAFSVKPLSRKPQEKFSQKYIQTA